MKSKKTLCIYSYLYSIPVTIPLRGMSELPCLYGSLVNHTTGAELVIGDTNNREPLEITEAGSYHLELKTGRGYGSYYSFQADFEIRDPSARSVNQAALEAHIAKYGSANGFAFVLVSYEAERVLAVDTHSGMAYEVRFDLPLGEQLPAGHYVEATPRHPFYCVNSHSWVAAGELRSGDLLMTFTGDTLPVQEVVRSVRTSAPVYNLTVEGAHTYFVGVGDGEAVLVHNTCAYRKGDALYEIGTYRELKAARQGNSAYKGLDAHHIPSKQFMKTYGIDPDDAVAIMVPRGTHKQTLSYGRWSVAKVQWYSQLSPEDALRLDLSNLRAVLRSEGVTDPAVLKHVDQVADYCRKLYPHLFS